MKKFICVCLISLLATGLALAGCQGKQKKTQLVQTWTITGERNLKGDFFTCKIKSGNYIVQRGAPGDGTGWVPFEITGFIYDKDLISDPSRIITLVDVEGGKMGNGINVVLDEETGTVAGSGGKVVDKLTIPRTDSAMKKTFGSKSFRNVKITKKIEEA